MSLKHGLLGLLNYGSQTGYELDRVADESINMFWRAQKSQIYRELTNMEKKGWIDFEFVVQTDKPNKKVYSINEKGKKELMNWLGSYDAVSYFTVRNPFLMQMFFAGENEHAKNIETLKRFRDDCLTQVKMHQKAYENAEKYGKIVGSTQRSMYWLIVADYGEMAMQTIIEWINKSIERLKNESISN